MELAALIFAMLAGMALLVAAGGWAEYLHKKAENEKMLMAAKSLREMK
jgi:hypothetical protein